MMCRNLAALFALFSLPAITGCRPAIHRATPDGMNEDDSDPDGSTVGNVPIHLKYAGIYEANASIDLTQNGVLPGPLSPILDAIRELHDEPGQVLIDIVIASDIPNVSQTLKQLPGWVSILLRDLLNETIKDLLYANSPSIDKIAELAQNIAEIARSSVIKSQLTIHTPDQKGGLHIDQKVTGMAFQLFGKSVDVEVPLSGLAAATTQMLGTLQTQSANKADATISFSGGKEVIPVGDFVLESLGPLLFQPLSGQKTLGQTLAALIDCEAVGDGVAGSDGQGWAGVGHDLVVGICQLGLTAIAAEVENELHHLTLDNVRIVNAKAVLYDVSESHPTVDHQSDRVAEGTWTWSIGSTDIPSAFAGERIGVAN